jgi:hypothetical protein
VVAALLARDFPSGNAQVHFLPPKPHYWLTSVLFLISNPSPPPGFLSIQLSKRNGDPVFLSCHGNTTTVSSSSSSSFGNILLRFSMVVVLACGKEREKKANLCFFTSVATLSSSLLFRLFWETEISLSFFNMH